MKKNLAYVALIAVICAGCGPSKDELAQKGREAFYAGRYLEAKEVLSKAGTKNSELLGVIYYWGLGVKQNMELADTYLRYSNKNEAVSFFCLGDINLIDAIGTDTRELRTCMSGALSSYQKAKELGYEGRDLDTRIDILSRILDKMEERRFSKSYAGGDLGSFFYGYASEGWGVFYNRNSLHRSYTMTFGFWRDGYTDGEVLQAYIGDRSMAGTYVGYPMVGTI